MLKKEVMITFYQLSYFAGNFL